MRILMSKGELCNSRSVSQSSLASWDGNGNGVTAAYHVGLYPEQEGRNK